MKPIKYLRDNKKLMSEWDYEKNIGINPNEIGGSVSKKVSWICEKCGYKWQATVNSRDRGNGCPNCAGKVVIKGVNDLETVNPELAKEWHPTKNINPANGAKLLPSDVTAGSGRKVCWKCKTCEHEWKATIASRNAGNGCPKCKEYLRTSYQEQAIYYYLKKIFPDAVNRELIDKKYEVDIFIPSINLGVEYDGEYYHKNASKKESEKFNYLLKKGIRLIRVKDTMDDISNVISENDVIRFPIKNHYKYLDDAIKALIQLICGNCDIDVNISRYNREILESYKQSLTESTLDKKYPELIKEWHTDKNGNLKPEMFTPGSDKRVSWVCKTCGYEWESSISNRVRGRGCPVCAGKKVLKGFNDLETLYPEIAKEWHPTKNINPANGAILLPSDVTAGSEKKVWWKCKTCGYEWPAVIYSRIERGCPVCAGKQVLKGFNDLETINPELAKEWHPTKNTQLPSDVTAGSKKKICWMCNKGHFWQATISERIRGRGCPYCAGKKVWKGFNDLETKNPELAKQWHPTKNTQLPSDVTAGSGKIAWWICELGHDWPATINSRNKGNGCPYCAGKLAWKGFNDLQTKNPELAKEWHPTKNTLLPSDVTIGSHKIVCWKCSICEHEWEASVHDRQRGRGCPNCAKERRKSHKSD